MLDPVTFTQDVRDLDDDQLDALRVVVLTEQERRSNLALIPAQIADLAGKYREGGGDEQALTDALTPEERDALDA